MKVSQGADHLRLVLKHDTALDLCLFQIVEGAKGAIGDAFIGQWPQALTGLQFRGIGRQKEQMDALGHHQLYCFPSSWLFQAFDDKLNKIASDRIEG